MDNRQRVEVAFDSGSLLMIERQFDWRDARSYETAPRMYVSTGDNVLEDMMNRRRRPYNVYKSLIRWSNLGSIIDLGKLSWSQHAGCSCPCSPGFILNPQQVEVEDMVFRRWDGWLTLAGAPSVDPSKPGRLVTV